MNKNEIAEQLRDYSDHLALPLEVGEVMRKAAEALEHSLSAQDEVLTPDLSKLTRYDEHHAMAGTYMRIKSNGDYVLFEDVEELLATTPPSLAVREKPNADCSGEPANCPDNEGYGCACDPMNKAAMREQP